MTQKISRSPKSIPTHFGMTNFYKHYLSMDYNDNIESVHHEIYNNVVGDFHKFIIEAIIKDRYKFTLPHLKFKIFLVKYKSKFILKDDVLVNTSPVNWRLTRKLWDEDPELKRKKVLIRFINRHTNGYVFKIFLNRNIRSRKILKSRYVYAFNASRFFKRRLAELIKEDRIEPIDCLIINKKRWHRTEE